MKFGRKSTVLFFFALAFFALSYFGARNSMATEEKRNEESGFRIYSTYETPSEYNNWDYLLYGSLILSLSCVTAAV